MPQAVHPLCILAEGTLTEGTLAGVVLAQGGESGGILGGPFGSLLPFLVIGMLFYLLLIRPERKKRQEMGRMLDDLKKDDEVVTVGGVWGLVVNASKGSEYITIRVDEGSGAKLRVLRSAISRVVTGSNSDASKESAS